MICPANQKVLSNANVNDRHLCTSHYALKWLVGWMRLPAAVASPPWAAEAAAATEQVQCPL